MKIRAFFSRQKHHSLISLLSMSAPTRTEVIRWLGTAIHEERLGLFVGTGFSMAATDGLAPSFKALLERSAKALGLPDDLNAQPFLQKSYPQIATQLIAELVAIGKAPSDANSILRRTIVDLCNLAPAESKRAQFEKALIAAAPSWIITTNYDLVLQALLENGRTVLPSQALFPSNTQVPIYHLHGHRYDPASIRVTEEDYVSLLAPLDYQRLKLPLLFLESTTLLLGYALGDINVRAAMEWSESFKGSKGLKLQSPQGRVVQAFFTGAPSDAPRIGPSGEIIIEINDIPTLLEEIGEAAYEIHAYEEYQVSDLHLLLDTANAQDITIPGATRNEFLELIEKSVGAVPFKKLIEFLERATSPIWDKAKKNGGFAYYGDYLSAFLEVLKKLEYREANPNFIAYLAHSLNKVGSYFSEKRDRGSAWDASERWRKDAPTLNGALLRELNSFAKTNDLPGLKSLMDCSTLRAILSS